VAHGPCGWQGIILNTFPKYSIFFSAHFWKQGLTEFVRNLQIYNAAMAFNPYYLLSKMILSTSLGDLRPLFPYAKVEIAFNLRNHNLKIFVDFQ